MRHSSIRVGFFSFCRFVGCQSIGGVRTRQLLLSPSPGNFTREMHFSKQIFDEIQTIGLRFPNVETRKWNGHLVPGIGREESASEPRKITGASSCFQVLTRFWCEASKPESWEKKISNRDFPKIPAESESHRAIDRSYHIRLGTLFQIWNVVEPLYSFE